MHTNSTSRFAKPASQLSLAALQARFRSFGKAAGTAVAEDQRRLDQSIIHAAGYTVEGRRTFR